MSLIRYDFALINHRRNFQPLDLKRPQFLERMQDGIPWKSKTLNLSEGSNKTLGNRGVKNTERSEMKRTEQWILQSERGKKEKERDPDEVVCNDERAWECKRQERREGKERGVWAPQFMWSRGPLAFLAHTIPREREKGERRWWRAHKRKEKGNFLYLY